MGSIIGNDQMSSDQFPLFERRSRQLRRGTDPTPSDLGAIDVLPRLGKLQARALRAVGEWPGRTSTELAHLCGYGDPRRINRRITELVRGGLIIRGEIRTCTVTKRVAAVYYPKPEKSKTCNNANP